MSTNPDEEPDPAKQAEMRRQVAERADALEAERKAWEATLQRLTAQAVDSLARRHPVSIERAGELYKAYVATTEGRSAISGARLPPFAECPPLVRAAWLAVADAVDAERLPRS